MPCLAPLLACGTAALIAPAAPATRSPRRLPIPALHSLCLPAPLYLHPRPTLHLSACRRIPCPRFACRLHPALCPHPAACSAHLLVLTCFARASPQRIMSSQRPHTCARASPLFALRPRTPGLRPHSAPAWSPRLRPHPAALHPHALLPRLCLATPPSLCLRLRFAPAPALLPGLASP
ncbi:hypothetical protein B0H14DRAFT_2671325 [Mycena olivaceomarginata]|nr:hypothetical protein B0H14DRAFT_2671325 [Mycena olivaceomarginata]